MLSQSERLLASAEGRKKELAAEGKSIIEASSNEGRDRTQEETSKLADIHAAIEHIDKDIEQFKSQVEVDRSILEGAKGITDGGGVSVGDISDVHVQDRFTPAEAKQLGDQFIESKGYKELMDRGLSGQWSQTVELDTKTTLTTTPGTALTPRQYQPGIVETLYQRNYVGDLMMQSNTTASQVAYVVESTATNAAAAVAEGAAKPESAFAFTETVEPIRKVATILPISDETLADAPQIRAYLNGRLALFVANQEEAQLLLGSGTSPNVAGLISAARTIGTYARGTVDNNAVALFKAMNGTRGSSQLDPDAIIIHPNNWQAIRLLTDTSGQFFGGGPFYGPYGGPQGPAGASQFSADNIWGVRVVVTSNITVGTALVGAFSQAAELVRRQGLTVEATNSHSTYFASNITTLRAESRLGMKVYRPTAFTAVTGLS